MESSEVERGAMTSVSVGIVVPHYGRSELLESGWYTLVDLLDKHTEWTCVIVQNGDASPDVGTLDRTPERRMMFARVAEPLGYGRACNVGAEVLKEANPDYLWFINNDCLIPDGSIIGALVERADELGLRLFSGGVVDTQGRLLRNWFHAPQYRTIALHLFRAQTQDHTLSNMHRSVEAVSGLSLFITRSLFERLGGFDARFFMYHEDLDLCRRAIAVGERPGILEEYVHVINTRPRWTRNVVARMRGCGWSIRSLHRYFVKWNGVLGAVLHLPLTVGLEVYAWFLHRRPRRVL